MQNRLFSLAILMLHTVHADAPLSYYLFAYVTIHENLFLRAAGEDEKVVEEVAGCPYSTLLAFGIGFEFLVLDLIVIGLEGSVPNSGNISFS